MLALFAAMTLAAAAPQAAPMADAAPFPAAKPFFRTMRPDELTARMHCKDAARFQTGYEPALLFRDQDRGNARARKLIELPNGAMCLVGERPTAESGAR